MDFYRNLNEREKKLVVLSLGLLGILLISFLINSVSSDLRKVIKFLKKNINLPLEGLYTHFATADEGDLGFANMQLKSFKKNQLKVFNLRKLKLNTLIVQIVERF